MANYFTELELREFISDPSMSADPLAYESAAAAACGAVNNYCRRKFDADTAATARLYAACNWGGILPVDDISSTTGLIVTVDGSTWTLNTDYRLTPFNGVNPSGESWAYTAILPLGTQAWVVDPYGAPKVSVTAKWGWPAVPAAVKHAALLMASRMFALKGAPLGVVGFGDLGAVRVAGNRDVEALLQPYVNYQNVGIA
jgi:hypothetical protein